MNKVFVEEKHLYKIDCRKAVWATDKVHEAYHNNKVSLLKDVDFIIEREEEIILLEYKNGNNPQAIAHGVVFKPESEKVINSIAEKYFDTLHYLNLLGKNKPKHYVWVLEYPHGSSVARKLIRNKIIKQLPFRLQADLSDKIKIIESFEVLSIAEWNDRYGEYRISKLEEK